MTEFCGNFYINPKFFNIFNSFPTNFYNSGQRRALLKSLNYVELMARVYNV